MQRGILPLESGLYGHGRKKVKHQGRGKGIYSITGKVTEEFDCINIEVISMYRLAIVEDPRYADKPKSFAL